MAQVQVIAVMKEMVEQLKGARTLTFDLATTDETVSPELEKLQFDSTIHGVIARPNKVHLTRLGRERAELWFDGMTLTLLDRSANQYLRVWMGPGSSLDALSEKLESLGVGGPFGALLSTRIERIIADYVLRGQYHGLFPVEGRSCHHLALRQDDGDWQLWIDEATSTPKRLVITRKMLTAAPQHQLRMQDLKLDEEVGDAEFEPNLPAGADDITNPYDDDWFPEP